VAYDELHGDFLNTVILFPRKLAVSAVVLCFYRGLRQQREKLALYEFTDAKRLRRRPLQAVLRNNNRRWPTRKERACRSTGVGMKWTPFRPGLECDALAWAEQCLVCHASGRTPRFGMSSLVGALGGTSNQRFTCVFTRLGDAVALKSAMEGLSAVVGVRISGGGPRQSRTRLLPAV